MLIVVLMYQISGPSAIKACQLLYVEICGQVSDREASLHQAILSCPLPVCRVGVDAQTSAPVDRQLISATAQQINHHHIWYLIKHILLEERKKVLHNQNSSYSRAFIREQKQQKDVNFVSLNM